MTWDRVSPDFASLARYFRPSETGGLSQKVSPAALPGIGTSGGCICLSLSAVQGCAPEWISLLHIRYNMRTRSAGLSLVKSKIPTWLLVAEKHQVAKDIVKVLPRTCKAIPDPTEDM